MVAMEKFAELYPADGELNDPVAGFEWEYRRTVGRILWYDDQLRKLSLDSLTWGKTREETVEATEFAGTNTVFENRVNLLNELQMQERKHLLAMQKIFIGAKLDERKLRIMESQVVALDAVITNTLRALGHDTDDPDVRATVRTNLLAVAPAIEA